MTFIHTSSNYFLETGLRNTYFVTDYYIPFILLNSLFLNHNYFSKSTSGVKIIIYEISAKNIGLKRNFCWNER
jgi:hypothetical protein